MPIVRDWNKSEERNSPRGNTTKDPTDRGNAMGRTKGDLGEQGWNAKCAKDAKDHRLASKLIY